MDHCLFMWSPLTRRRLPKMTLKGSSAFPPLFRVQCESKIPSPVDAVVDIELLQKNVERREYARLVKHGLIWPKIEIVSFVVK